MWAFFAILIVLSMVIAYSGFATLARTPKQTEKIEIPKEVREKFLNSELNGENINNTAEEQKIINAIKSSELEIDTNNLNKATQTPKTIEEKIPEIPPIPELKLEI